MAVLMMNHNFIDDSADEELLLEYDSSLDYELSRDEYGEIVRESSDVLSFRMDYRDIICANDRMLCVDEEFDNGIKYHYHYDIVPCNCSIKISYENNNNNDDDDADKKGKIKIIIIKCNIILL